jgi:predicted DCC family thiol-disulfide oxidoreductase YuxK
MPLAAAPQLTIWYDASCPLCATEMHALQSFSEAGRLRLLDCSAADFDEAETAAAGFSRSDLMRAIVARDAAGRWLHGVDVFEAAYRIAGLESVARMWGNRWLRPIWDRTYPWVARHRMLLSRLHLNAAFGWMVARAARRAQRRAQACSADRCDIP